MSLFFETLKVTNGTIANVDFHNKRLNNTIKRHFEIDAKIDLRDYIQQPDNTLQRCKVIYHKKIDKIQFFPLSPRKIQSFQVLHTDITYNFKNVDRADIDALFEKRRHCDEIIMIKDGLVTDTSIANIAYYDGFHWITPKKPLLEGTMRASLLKKQLLLEKDVKIKDIKNAVRIALMNALIGFQELKSGKICI